MRAYRLMGAAVLAVAASATALAAQQGGVEVACHPTAPPEQVAKRASPYDSTAVQLGQAKALICYSRPSLKGRHMVGGEKVPFGKLWRTGANEPTIIHVPVAATIAGLKVAPGSYAIYTIPAEKQWTIIVNRSTKQWGIEGQYTPDIEKQEVGRAKVAAQSVAQPIETFTIRSVPAGNAGSNVILEWEHSRVSIPVRVAKG